METDQLTSLIKQELHWQKLDKYPSFLRAYKKNGQPKYKWRPKYVFSLPTTNLIIAVDIIYNQQVSKKIYETEVAKALKGNSTLRVCLFSSLDYDYDYLKKFCKRNKFGLKVYTPNSINTILPFESEKTEGVSRRRARKEGWFPQIILSEVKKIKRIKYKKTIIGLVNKIEKCRTKDRQLALARGAIDKMLKASPNYIGNNIPFMRLSNFEGLFNTSDIKCKDHVFHSIRVFLMGCVIIDRFYDKFLSYYKEILGTDRIIIEYIWLLASLFHDIGRIKQEGHKIFLSDPKKENPEIEEGIEEEMRKRWKEEQYKISLANVVELIKQSCKRKSLRDLPFTGYALGGKIDLKIANILTESYNKRKSHGIISCFELSADILRKMEASNFKSKTFLLYHLFPAVVAMALHDWKIWEELSEAKIFPINIKNFPLTSLLIYIDTWDDYKRDGEEKISIDKLTMDDNQVTVYLTWYKNSEYLDEKLKYDSFERNVLFGDFKFKIEVSNKKR